MRRRSLSLALSALACLGASCSADEASPPTTTVTTTATVDPWAAAAGEVASGEPTPSAGCGSGTTTAVRLERRTLPGSDRWYLVTVPASAGSDHPLPVVLDFHGLAEGAELHSRVSQLAEYAEEHGFVAVQPNGTGTLVAWNGIPDRTANPDLVFVDALLDQLEADVCIDTSRVYATGLSNGAILSSVIACTMADRIVAVAPVAGLTVPERCEPTRRVPVLAFHGTADPILLFNGGVGGRLGAALGGDGAAEETPLPVADLDGDGFPAAADAWARRDGCSGEPTDADLTSSIIERSWSCPKESPVLVEIVVGGGHTWPGSEVTRSIEGIVGPTDMSVDATDLIWRFFQRFALPAD